MTDEYEVPVRVVVRATSLKAAESFVRNYLSEDVAFVSVTVEGEDEGGVQEPVV